LAKQPEKNDGEPKGTGRGKESDGKPARGGRAKKAKPAGGNGSYGAQDITVLEGLEAVRKRPRSRSSSTRTTASRLRTTGAASPSTS
jgi:hypothetical protein